MTSKHSVIKRFAKWITSYRQIWWHFKDWKFHPRLCPYFHVSVDVVETTVAKKEYTESTDGTVAETTLGVFPELTNAGAIEGNSCLTHGLLDKMIATSQKTFLNAFPPSCFAIQISLKFCQWLGACFVRGIRLELTQDMLGEQTFTCKAILSENNPEYVIIEQTMAVLLSKF